MQRICKYPIFVFFKKHHCPRCDAILERITFSKRVNPRSLEGNRIDSEYVPLYGDVLCMWDEFECPKCGKHVSVEDMVRIEREKKKQKRQLK